jgi:hypothetical protein
MTEEWIEAGARVILKNALRRKNIPFDAYETTHHLMVMGMMTHAGILEECDRWSLYSCGRPGLRDSDRRLMQKQAERVVEMYRKAAAS